MVLLALGEGRRSPSLFLISSRMSDLCSLGPDCHFLNVLRSTIQNGPGMGLSFLGLGLLIIRVAYLDERLGSRRMVKPLPHPKADEGHSEVSCAFPSTLDLSFIQFG